MGTAWHRNNYKNSVPWQIGTDIITNIGTAYDSVECSICVMCVLSVPIKIPSYLIIIKI